MEEGLRLLFEIYKEKAPLYLKEHEKIRKEILNLTKSGALEKKVKLTPVLANVGRCYYIPCVWDLEPKSEDYITLEFLDEDIVRLKEVGFHKKCYEKFLSTPLINEEDIITSLKKNTPKVLDFIPFNRDFLNN